MAEQLTRLDVCFGIEITSQEAAGYLVLAAEELNGLGYDYKVRVLSEKAGNGEADDDSVRVEVAFPARLVTTSRLWETARQLASNDERERARQLGQKPAPELFLVD